MNSERDDVWAIQPFQGLAGVALLVLVVGDLPWPFRNLDYLTGNAGRRTPGNVA